MSTARLVITALVVEGLPVSEVAARYGVHRSWVHRLKARYDAEGDVAFEPRSRRPLSSPTAVAAGTVELIVALRKRLAGQGLDAGPETIVWHLREHHGVTVSRASVSRHLKAQGLITPEPAKRPRSSYIRFQAVMPNECWQADFTHYRLTRRDGSAGADVEILSWLDDCSRYALAITAHPRVTGPIVLTAFCASVAAHGVPASTLTDNGMVFTTRWSGGRGGRNALETELRRLDIVQKNSRPNHPTTCGKVERFQQTMKKWLRAQRRQPTTIAELQRLLNRFAELYNTTRPHRSLPHRATPAAIYTALPKAAPTAGARTSDSHDRVRHDKIDDSGVVTLRLNGRLHHIGIGRTHARTHVILLVHDLSVRIVATATGELLRELTINPHKDYQPQDPKRRPPNLRK
jgi:transposase InsO family protein